ncbi:MAG: DUF4340 domain-containing protein [Alphaproteobacteria bacterium]|nr:DUF4340 domain-containing protein [Alphaproteobacteria bacterium]
MSQRLTNILGYLTLFAILGAIWVLFGEDPTREQGGRGEPTFEGIKDRINDVVRIKLSQTGERTTLVRSDVGWSVEERDGYAADAELVRSFLRGVAISERRDPKTANPERFMEIGLGEAARKIELFASEESPLLSFDMGKQSTITADRSLTYVWQKTDTRSWLVTALAEVEAKPSFWLASDILNIADARINRVEMENVVLSRAIDAQEFSLEDLKEGEQALPAWRLGEPARVIADLTFEDVRHLGNPLTDPTSTVTLNTHDGLVLTLALHDMEGSTWAQLDARFDKDLLEAGDAGTVPDAVADVAAEASSLSEQSRGWFYRLSTADARVLLQGRTDFLENGEK